MFTYHLLNKNQSDTLDVSAYFWELIRPLDERDPKDVTKYLLPVIVHPTDGRVAIVIEQPEEVDGVVTNPKKWVMVKINSNAQDANIDAKTEDLENKGIITAVEKTQLRVSLKNNKGKKIKITDLIPAKYQTPKNTLTQAEAEAEGWFGDAI